MTLQPAVCLFLSLVLALGTSFPFGPANDALAATPAPIKVISQPVVTVKSSQSFETIATGWADKSAWLYPEAEERVTGVYFKAQQKVKKGDLLVQLDNREELLAHKLAEVELESARSLLARYQEAVKQGAVPQTQVDEAQAQFDSAQVALEKAKLALADRQVRAPFDGVVGIPQADVGQRVARTTRISGIDSREIILIDFEVPDTLAPALQQGQPIVFEARTPSLPGQVFKARLTDIESRFKPETRTIGIRVQIDNKRDLLRPGMSFTMLWQIEGQDTPAVPEIAVQWSRDGSYLWVIREDKAHRLPVRVRSRQAGQVLLEGEFQPNDEVIVEGVQRVRQGSPVQRLQTESTRSQATTATALSSAQQDGARR